MSKLDRLFCQFTYQNGISPQGYKRIVDYQILKKAGIFAVEKMRTIQLMVASFNMNNKRTGCCAMRRAEQHQLLAREQGGSRKNRRANYLLVDKILSLDTSRFRRLPCAIVSCDAKSCYDRIVINIAMLICRQCGLSADATVFLAKFLSDT